MSLSNQDRMIIDEYRTWLEQALSDDQRFGVPQRHDRPDGSHLATRFAVSESVWVELAIRPVALQVQASILTDDRWASEEMEQAIEDSGDSMPEFVEMGFEDAGLDWPEPPVLHYREAGKLFYFSTPLDIESLSALSEEPLRTKTIQMAKGYCHAFGPVVAGGETD